MIRRLARSSLFLASTLALAAPVAAERSAFTNVALVDQDGEEVLLHDDLLHGKVLVMSSFFTSCETTCPKVTGVMRQVQRRLGVRSGRTVHLLSFSVDPTVDTPERLRAYMERHGVEEGWTFVTGTPENVDEALRQLGFYSDGAENHASLVVVGNELEGTWRKADGLGSPRDILRLVRKALADEE